MSVCSTILATVVFALTLVAAKATIGADILFVERTKARLLEYPTQITQNIMPKMIHSHNDCEFARLETDIHREQTHTMYLSGVPLRRLERCTTPYSA